VFYTKKWFYVYRTKPAVFGATYVQQSVFSIQYTLYSSVFSIYLDIYNKMLVVVLVVVVVVSGITRSSFSPESPRPHELPCAMRGLRLLWILSFPT
jgi:hypothetical protein